jgi:hypothetical protein
MKINQKAGDILSASDDAQYHEELVDNIAELRDDIIEKYSSKSFS